MSNQEPKENEQTSQKVDVEQAQATPEPEVIDEGTANEAEGAASADPVSDLLKQIESLQEEVKTRKEEALRVRAEMENYRKRAQREKDELRKIAAANIVEELLPVLDNMKLGLQSAQQHPEAKVVADGFEMVNAQLRSTLEGHGLKELNPKGEAFDPNFHDCMSEQTSEDVGADHVLEVIRAGYMLGERLLRPASVIVSSGSAKASEPTQEEENTPGSV